MKKYLLSALLLVVTLAGHAQAYGHLDVINSDATDQGMVERRAGYAQCALHLHHPDAFHLEMAGDTTHAHPFHR